MKENPYLVFNKHEWLTYGWFTEEELDNANKLGLIGTKNGIDCYIAKLLLPTS